MQPRILAQATLSMLFLATTTWAGVRPAEALSSSDPSTGVCSIDDGAAGPNVCAETPATGAAPLPEATPHAWTVSRDHLREPVGRSVVEAAKTLLDLPLGSEVVLEVEGRPYGFRLEPHYHPPGYVGGPIGWHKGVTLYHVVERDADGSRNIKEQ